MPSVVQTKHALWRQWTVVPCDLHTIQVQPALHRERKKTLFTQTVAAACTVESSDLQHAASHVWARIAALKPTWHRIAWHHRDGQDRWRRGQMQGPLHVPCGSAALPYARAMPRPRPPRTHLDPLFVHGHSLATHPPPSSALARSESLDLFFFCALFFFSLPLPSSALTLLSLSLAFAC